MIDERGFVFGYPGGSEWLRIFFERLPVNFVFPTRRSFTQLARQNATPHFNPDLHIGEHPRHLSPPDRSPGNPP